MKHRILLCAAAAAYTISFCACASNNSDNETIQWTLDQNGTLTISGKGDMENWDDDNSAPWLEQASEIKNVVIGEGVTSIGTDAFSCCEALTSVTMPDSLTSIGDYAFILCENLTSVTLPDGVASIGNDAFCRCFELKEIRVSEGNPNFCAVDGILFSKNMTDIVYYPEGKQDSAYAIPDSVVNICDSAFYDCDLTSVIIPESVTNIGSFAFSCCTRLESVTIPDSVTSIGDSAFSNCRELTSVTIPAGVKSIDDGAFFNCESLTSVKISDSVTSIGDFAFSSCNGLTSVTIPDSVISIGEDAFSNCEALISVTIPDRVLKVGTRAFSCCPALKDLIVSADNPHFIFTDGVLYSKDQTQLLCYPAGRHGAEYVIPDGVTSIGDSAFYGCNGLKTVKIPNSVTAIGDSAFSSCEALNSVTMPDSVTDIGKSAFSACAKLTDITIPKGLTRLQEDTFHGCNELGDFTVPENVTSIGPGALCYSNGDLFAVTILNPNCSIETRDEAVTIASDAIYGYPGSTAEHFAKETGKLFEEIEKPE